MQQDDLCVVALVNRSQNSLTTVELAAVSTGQTPVDPLSK